MKTIKILNAIITVCVVVMILSLTLVEKQPLVFSVTVMAGIGIVCSQRLKAEIHEKMHIRSNADEDRPE